MKRTHLYRLWLTAFGLKSIGASWDASYHFKYLRDLTQVPHLVNGAGNALVVLLWLYMWRTTEAEHRKPLKAVGMGFLVFLFAIPFDDWWHRAYGIDLTTWSPAHFSLYAGTMLMIIGAIWQAQQDGMRGLLTDKARKWVQTGLLAFVLEAVWFPLLQQEQGVIAHKLFLDGTPIASDEILVFLTDPTSQIYGGIPDWLYGVYACLAALFVFRMTKSLGLFRSSALAVAAVYVAFRAVMDLIYQATVYQQSTVPYYLLAAALLFDLLYTTRARWLAVPGTVLCAYALSFVSTEMPLVPPLVPPMPHLYMIAALFTGALGYGLAAMVDWARSAAQEMWYNVTRNRLL